MHKAPILLLASDFTYRLLSVATKKRHRRIRMLLDDPSLTVHLAFTKPMRLEEDSILYKLKSASITFNPFNPLSLEINWGGIRMMDVSAARQEMGGLLGARVMSAKQVDRL